MRVLFIIAIAVLLIGLAAAAPGRDAVARGKKLFLDTQDLEYPSCAHCHGLLPEDKELKEAEFLGPGHTLWGVAVREGWRNMNTFADAGEAAQYCAKTWQKRKRGLDAAPRADLIAFLKTFGPDAGTLPKRDVQRKPKLTRDFDGGDKAKGKALAARYCGNCHNDSDDAISFALKPRGKKTKLIVRKVRGYDAKNKFKPQKGTMAYYRTDRLSDRDLRHILAYAGK